MALECRMHRVAELYRLSAYAIVELAKESGPKDTGAQVADKKELSDK